MTSQVTSQLSKINTSLTQTHNGPLIGSMSANSECCRFRSAHNALGCQMLQILFRGVMVCVQRKAPDWSNEGLENRLYWRQIFVKQHCFYNASFVKLEFFIYECPISSILSQNCVCNRCVTAVYAAASWILVRS